MESKPLTRYRNWFYAAAIYNLVWGSVVVLFPLTFFQWANLPLPNYPDLWKGIGMIVGVYGLGYWLVAVDPDRFGPFVYVGLLGKVFGPIGFLISANQGELPWRFGWIHITNDLVWLPAFFGFAWELWKREGLAVFRIKSALVGEDGL